MNSFRRYFSVRERVLLAVFLVVVVLALASCSSLPPRDVYVAWRGPCSGEQAQVVRVRFIDSAAPITGCVRAAIDRGETGYVASTLLLTMIGVPPAACIVSFADRADIYAAVSPPASAIMAALAMQSTDDILVHEISHAFGSDHFGCRP